MNTIKQIAEKLTINSRSLRITIPLLALMLLSGCIRPYQPDVQQGNILNNSDLGELRYGMTKQEVLFILGTPMVIDPFNESRWDYYYSRLDHQKRETKKRLVTAEFDGDTLVKLSGDVDLSNVQNLEPSIEDMQHGGTVITEPTWKEKGIFNRIKRSRKKSAERKAEKRRAKEAKERAEGE